MFRKILLCSLLALPVAGICQKAKKGAKKTVAVAAAPAIDYKLEGAPMPPLRIVTKDKTSITGDMVKTDGNLVVMMFNPTCGHCEEMTIALTQNIAQFKKTKIVLVAAAMMTEYMPDFYKTVKSAEYPSIQIGVDSSQFIDKAFNYNGLPQVNVYDQNRKLIKAFNGITTIDSLKPYIQ